MAPAYDQTKDLTLLNQPINLGIKNVTLLLKSVKVGTVEIKDAILNESNLIYECFICHAFFRNAEMFADHLQHYCVGLERNNVAAPCNGELEIVHHEVEIVEEPPITTVQPSSPLPLQEEKLELIKEPMNKESQVIVGSRKRKMVNPIKVQSKVEGNSPYKRLIIDKLQVKSPISDGAFDPISHLDKYINGSQLDESGQSLHLHQIRSNRNAYHQVKTDSGMPSPSIIMLESPNKRAPIEITAAKVPKANSSKNYANQPLLECSDCSDTFLSEKSLKNHKMHRHNYVLQFECIHCSSLFEESKTYRMHLMEVHDETKEQAHKVVEEHGYQITKAKPEVSVKIKCSHCLMQFSTNIQKYNHSKSCPKQKKSLIKPQPQEISIEEESAYFTTNDIELNKLSRPKRNKLKKLDDNFVDSQTFKISSSNKDHEPKAISKSPPSKANLQNNNNSNNTTKQSFKGIETLMNKYASEKELKCNICFKNFSTYSNLRRHVAIHMGWYRFGCKACDKKFFNKSECRDHVLKVHDSNSPDKFLTQFQAKKYNTDFIIKHKKNQSLSNKTLSPKKAQRKLSL